MPREFAYAFDGEWHYGLVRSGGRFETPDGWGIPYLLPPPFPPDAAANECRGETARGSVCQLTYNWGRRDPDANPGRCRFHADQSITMPEAPTVPTGAPSGYGAAGYGEIPGFGE